MALKVGQKAPLFKLPSTSGTDFELENQKGNHTLVYFYPKDFTPGCTAEACSFNDNIAVFNNLKCKVVGISTDSISSHKKFKENFNLDFELLSDVSGKVSKQYDSLIPILKSSKRITYLVSPDLKILAVFNSLFNAKKHVTEMVKEVKKLS